MFTRLHGATSDKTVILSKLKLFYQKYGKAAKRVRFKARTDNLQTGNICVRIQRRIRSYETRSR